MMRADLDVRMDERANGDGILVEALQAIASPSRLGILRQLRSPRALREVVVRGEDNGGAPLARQSVRKHLDTLIDAGLVFSRTGERDYGETSEFIVNHQRIYLLSEEVRGLARMRPTVEVDHPTIAGGAASPIPRGRPLLVLVKGLDEGATFDLRPQEEPHRWVVGRARGSGVCLDFDPSVSSENALIEWRDGAHHLRDLPGSRNGTTHNLRPLGTNEQVRLDQGDIIGVGRSLLVYRAG